MSIDTRSLGERKPIRWECVLYQIFGERKPIRWNVYYIRSLVREYLSGGMSIILDVWVRENLSGGMCIILDLWGECVLNLAERKAIRWNVYYTRIFGERKPIRWNVYYTRSLVREKPIRWNVYYIRFLVRKKLSRGMCIILDLW